MRRAGKCDPQSREEMGQRGPSRERTVNVNRLQDDPDVELSDKDFKVAGTNMFR